MFLDRRRHTIERNRSKGNCPSEHTGAGVDAGLKCPLPVLRARKALRDVPPGGLLRVLATDPGSVADFRAWCDASANELAEWRDDAGVYEFLVRRTA